MLLVLTNELPVANVHGSTVYFDFWVNTESENLETKAIITSE